MILCSLAHTHRMMCAVERLAVFVDRRRKNAKTRKERDFSVPHVFINKLQVILGLL